MLPQRIEIAEVVEWAEHLSEDALIELINGLTDLLSSELWEELTAWECGFLDAQDTVGEWHRPD